MRNKGQTLLEVIIATGILSVAMVAILGVVIQSLVAGAESKQRTQATFLAQDAIERILFDRNRNNVLIKEGSSVPWDDGFYTQNGFYDNGECCYGNQFPFVWLSDTEVDDDRWDFGGLHVYDGVSFTRYIEIKQRDGSPDEREVNVKVTWPTSKDQGEVYVSAVITKLP